MFDLDQIIKFQAVMLDHKGRDRAIRKEDLMVTLDIKDERKLRQLVQDQIDSGFPVCSADNEAPYGYYFPADVKEAEECYRAGRKETVHRMVRLRKMLNSAKTYYLRINEGAKQLVLI